jgi:hypothetical protein
MRLTTAAVAALLAAGCTAASSGAVSAAASSAAASSGAVHAATAAAPSRPPRPLPRVLYGVTADDVSALPALVASSRHLSHAPTTRLYLDVRQPPRAYAKAVKALHPVSYLMGELLDSSDETAISTPAYGRRVEAYLKAFGSQVDIWEIGNEVNGNWTGPYPVVAAKLETAYRLAAARHQRTALTLYYNVGCGDGPAELDPLAFSRRYIHPFVRNGLSYVFLSYYEDQCGGARPSAATWTRYFTRLHALFPRARLGFGEVGLGAPATARTTSAAKALIRRYYGLPIRLPYYAGGYFWWYYAEDCLPYAKKPLWRALNAGFALEARALAPGRKT